MSGAASQNGHAADDLDVIKAEIEATREQLGRTADELSARLDVPAHARERAFRARDTVVETYRENPPIALGAVGAVVGPVVGMIILRRKRATSKRNLGRKR